MTAPTRDDYLTPEIERTVAALVRRHPAFLAHERFIRDRLAELGQRAYQHGESAAIFGLHTTNDVAALLGVTRAWVGRVARRNGIGWDVGRDLIFRDEDIPALREAMARGARRRTAGPSSAP